MMAVVRRGTRATSAKHNIPMDEAKLVDRFDCENTLCDVETGDVFRERVILDQHGHQVAAREEFHD